MSYVYVKSEKSRYEEGQYYPGLWTVGFYRPDGTWEPDSDWPSSEEAASRVHYLNGGGSNMILPEQLPEQSEATKEILIEYLSTAWLAKTMHEHKKASEKSSGSSIPEIKDDFKEPA